MPVSTSHTASSATRFAACIAFLMGIGAFGCSSLDPASDSCDVLGLDPCDAPAGSGSSEQTAVEPNMPPAWQCLATPREPPPSPENAATARVTYVVPVVDFDSSTVMPLAVPNVRLTVCTNAACDPPAACFPEGSCTPAPAPNPTGVAIVQPRPTEQPFLYAINMRWGTESVVLRASAEGYVDSEYYVGGAMVGPPEGGDTVLGLPFFLLTDAARAALYSQLGLGEVDATKGILAARTLNCNREQSPLGVFQGVRADNVSVELVPNEVPSEAIPWVLSFGRVASRDIFVTDDRGAAGFANIEPRAYQVQGRAPAPVGSESGTTYGRTLATVRANTITIVEVRDGQDVWGQ